MGKNAQESDRRVGERMVDDEVKWLVVKAQEMLEAYDREQPTQKLHTFEEVERIWDEVIRPHFKDFKTMQQSWTDAQTLQDSSVWHKNSHIPNRS